MSDLSTQQLDDARTALVDRANVLRGEVAAVEEDRAQMFDAASGVVEDDGDIAEDLRADEVRHAEEDRDQAELRDIDAALARIADGVYGTCVDCGLEIALPRLMAQPSAARCIVCQQRHEHAAAGIAR